MKYPIQDHLLELLETGSLDITLKDNFISRIQQGNLTRDENPTSHVCAYFAAHDPILKLVFIGHHIKSGLWLFNGGHVDKSETLENALYREMGEEWGVVKKINTNSPSLFTLTKIKKPTKQICEWHYDIWYFIPFHKNEFHPIKDRLAKEFSEWGWKTIDEAKSLVTNESTLQGIDYLS